MSESGDTVKRLPRKAALESANKKTRDDSGSDESSSNSIYSMQSDNQSDGGHKDGQAASGATDVAGGSGDANTTINRAKKRKCDRETAEEAKGDTAIQYIETRRGGQAILFRSYFFHISRKHDKNKSYYRCQTRDCRVTLVIEGHLFKSISGTHTHEPDADVKLLRIQKKKEKIEHRNAARIVRMEQMKIKQEERKKKVAEVALTRATKDDMSLDDILAMQQVHSFDQTHFDVFDNQLTKLFQYLNQNVIQFDGNDVSFENLAQEWDIQRQRIRTMASIRDRKRDKRFNLLKKKLDTTINEKEAAESARKELETSVSSVNIAGCQLLLNQLQNIQRLHNLSGDNEVDDAVQQIVEPSSNHIALINGQMIEAETDHDTDLKSLYERTIKERDQLALQLIQQSTIQTTHQVIKGPNVQMPAISQDNQSQATVTVDHTSQNITSIPIQARSHVAPNYPAMQHVATLQGQHAMMPNYSHFGHLSTNHVGQNSPGNERGAREPQIILFEGSQAQRLWQASSQ